MAEDTRLRPQCPAIMPLLVTLGPGYVCCELHEEHPGRHEATVDIGFAPGHEAQVEMKWGWAK